MKYQQLAIIAAVIALVYLSILWPLEVGAQEVPPETPQISATWWVPTPTVTRRPTPTPTQIVISPLPQHYVWLPLAVK